MSVAKLPTANGFSQRRHASGITYVARVVDLRLSRLLAEVPKCSQSSVQSGSSCKQAYPPLIPDEGQHESQPQQPGHPYRGTKRTCCGSAVCPLQRQAGRFKTHLVKPSEQAGDAPLDILLGQARAGSVAPHRVPAGDARGGGGSDAPVGGEGRSRDDRGEASAGGGDDGPARGGGGGGSEGGCAEHFCFVCVWWSTAAGYDAN